MTTTNFRGTTLRMDKVVAVMPVEDFDMNFGFTVATEGGHILTFRYGTGDEADSGHTEFIRSWEFALRREKR